MTAILGVRPTECQGRQPLKPRHPPLPRPAKAARCYEEKVLRSVADGNIGSIFGWGFPCGLR